MCPDIAQRPANSRFRRVRTPRSLLRPQLLLRLHQPVLQILHQHLPNRPHLAALEQMPRVPDHRIARIVMRQSKHAARPFHHTHQSFRLLQRERHRLIANHMEARFQKRFRRPEMHVIRRHNTDEIDPLIRRQSSLRRSHSLIVFIGACRADVQPRRRSQRIRLIAAEHTSDQLHLLIQRRRHTMDRPNKGALPAANHPHPKFPLSLHKGRFYQIQHFLSVRISAVIRVLPCSILRVQPPPGIWITHSFSPQKINRVLHSFRFPRR